jgi:hypothetical protein
MFFEGLTGDIYVVEEPRVEAFAPPLFIPKWTTGVKRMEHIPLVAGMNGEGLNMLRCPCEAAVLSEEYVRTIPLRQRLVYVCTEARHDRNQGQVLPGMDNAYVVRSCNLEDACPFYTAKELLHVSRQ